MSDNNLSVKEILIQRKSEFEQFLQSIIPRRTTTISGRYQGEIN